MMSLPKTFRQLEYLEFTGAQSLMIPKPNGDIDNFGIEIKFNDTSNALRANSRLFSYAVGDGSGSKYLSLYYGSSGSDLYFRYMYSSSMTIAASFRQNYGFGDHVFKLQSSEIYIDGVKNSTTSKPVTIKQETSSTYFDNIHISSNQYPDNSLGCYKGKIYYIKFFIGEDEIRNLIPVQRKSDNELGYYDLDSNEFFTNTLTTPWVAGPVIDENSINKIIYGNETLIDLTGDTVTAADVAEGKTFHLADGSQAVGTSQGGSLEEINYSLMCGCTNIDGSASGYFSICYEIIKPDGGIINVPNIPHLVNSPSNTSGGSYYYNYWKYNNNVNWSFGHEGGEGKLPSSTYPSVIWTITGKCPKGSSLRLVYQMYGNKNWGAPQDVTANILGTSTSATYNPSNSTGYTGNYIGTAAIVNDDIVSTYGHGQDNNGDHDWHTISITTAS